MPPETVSRVSANGLVESNPAILEGTPVFRGTGLPVATLFDYLADGLTIDFFVANYPLVGRDKAQSIVAYGWARIESELDA